MFSGAHKLLFLSIAVLFFSADADAFKHIPNRQSVDLNAKLREELEVKERPYQFCLAPLINTSSNDIKTGIGGSILFDYDGLKPIAFEAVLGLYWSKFKTIFPGQKVLSFNGDLDVLYRPALGPWHPYLGAGIGVISNSWPTGKPDTSYSLGGYDEQTPTINLDFGTTFAVHLRSGLFVKLGKTISLFGDIRVTTNSLETPVVITTYPSGATKRDEAAYKVGAVSLKLGIALRVWN